MQSVWKTVASHYILTICSTNNVQLCQVVFHSFFKYLLLLFACGLHFISIFLNNNTAALVLCVTVCFS